MKLPFCLKKMSFAATALLLFLFLSESSVAQVKILRTNWANSMIPLPNPNPNFQPFGANVCVLLYSDNELHIQLTAAVALDDINPYPAMYIEYEYGGISGATPVITNDDLVEYTDVITGATFYQAFFVISFDLSSNCIDPANVFDINYEYSLKTPTFGGGVIYPINNYSGPGELFDATIFEETSNGTQPIYSGTKEICCPEVRYLVSNNNNEIGMVDPLYADATQKTNKVDDGQFEANPALPFTQKKPVIYPLVFSDRINLNFEFERPIKSTLLICDLTGKVLFSKEFLPAQQIDETLFLPSQNWAKGMYLMSMVNSEGRILNKVIKE